MILAPPESRSTRFSPFSPCVALSAVSAYRTTRAVASGRAASIDGSRRSATPAHPNPTVSHPARVWPADSCFRRQTCYKGSRASRRESLSCLNVQEPEP